MTRGEEKGVYIRVGNSNRLAGPEVIAEIKRSNNYSSFDKAPCDDVTENDLDKALIKSIYASRGRAIDTSKLMSLGILTKKGRRIVATNGGVILFGLPEIRETYFPYAEVRCARFKGTSRSEFIDRLNIEGGILAAIDEVPKFIRRNTKMAGKFGDMRRRDIPEYPVEGIREALTNAIAHANYEVTGSRIFIAIYDDRLEIQNPGIMMPGMSIEQFKAGVSRIRNPVIAKTLGQLELIEEWGSGYKRIQNACERGGYPLPEWEEFGSALRVTFYPHPEVVELGAESGTQLAPSQHSALYPGHLWTEKKNFELNPDNTVTNQAPPTFLLQAGDDSVDSINHSLVYYAALKNANVPAEMHLYAKGDHGFGVRPTKYPITNWTQLLEIWLKTNGMIS